MRFFIVLTIFSIQNRPAISGSVLPYRQLTLCRFLGFLGIHCHLFGCRQKAKTDEDYQLNHFTGHTKKMVYVFHGNWDSFDLILITIIQPKIHKSNGFIRQRICFLRF